MASQRMEGPLVALRNEKQGHPPPIHVQWSELRTTSLTRTWTIVTNCPRLVPWTSMRIHHSANVHRFPSRLNPNSNPVGVVPPKHSSEWRTIYHLSYPEGDSINDYIPKGLGLVGWTMQSASFSPWVQVLSWRKQISNQPFAWSPFTLATGTCWVFTGKANTMSILIFPLGFEVFRSSLIGCRCTWVGSQK